MIDDTSEPLQARETTSCDFKTTKDKNQIL